MCVIVLAVEQHSRYRLVLAANRDEFYARPTAPAAFWDDAPTLLAGRDLEGGGTWMGITRSGRLAALTNVREPGTHRPDAPTRGALVADYLAGTMPAQAYLGAVHRDADRYNGFNLLLGDAQGLYYTGNRAPSSRRLEPGLYGLSNHLLDTPWPKVVRGKAALAEALKADTIAPETLFALLADAEPAPDDALPETGVGQDWERILSPLFIQSPRYGTRVSTVVLVERDGQVTFAERAHVPQADGAAPGTQRYTFQVDP